MSVEISCMKSFCFKRTKFFHSSHEYQTTFCGCFCVLIKHRSETLNSRKADFLSSKSHFKWQSDTLIKFQVFAVTAKSQKCLLEEVEVTFSTKLSNACLSTSLNSNKLYKPCNLQELEFSILSKIWLRERAKLMVFASPQFPTTFALSPPRFTQFHSKLIEMVQFTRASATIASYRSVFI